MEPRFAQLVRIDNNEPITMDSHDEFLCRLQSALLLALRERGRLSIMEYRHAEENLKQQRRERAKALQKAGEHP